MNGDDDGTHVHDLKPCMVSVLIYISKLEELVHDNMRNQPSHGTSGINRSGLKRACDASLNLQK